MTQTSRSDEEIFAVVELRFNKKSLYNSLGYIPKADAKTVIEDFIDSAFRYSEIDGYGENTLERIKGISKVTYVS